MLPPGVYAAASERYYKVAAEALRVCEKLVPVLRQDVEEPVDAAMTPLAQVQGGSYGFWAVTIWGGTCA